MSVERSKEHSSGGSRPRREGPPAAVSYSAVRGILFDLDGVIIDSLPVMRAAFAAAYHEVVGDGEPPFDEYRKHLGLYFPDIMRRMGLPLELYEPFVRESARRVSQVRVYPTVVEVLRILRASGVGCAVATAKAGDRARSVLAAVGLDGAFDLVRGADEVVNPKPAPDILLSLFEDLGVGVAEGLFVGDAETDLKCSRAAGVRFAAAAWGYGVAEDLCSRSDHCLRSPTELLALVGSRGG